MSSHITKFGPVSNYRIPPESSGKRVQHFEHYYFEVQNLSADFGFPATLFTASGVTGSVANYWVTGLGGQARLLVTLSEGADDVEDLVAAEQITINNTVSAATATLVSWSPVLTPAVSLVDPTSPDRAAAIDQAGALSTRFTEGEPQFDAFGLIRMTLPERLSDYTFTYSKQSNDWYQQVVGTAGVTHLPNESSIALDVDVGATDSITYTTNVYNSYTPGVSQLTVMTVACGDVGKADVVRRWGYFDDNDGLFFELDGTDLFVVRRSSVTGTPVEERIARSVWSGDQLDGSGDDHNASLVDLDVTKISVYWIDFQWLGAGKVRFGMFLPNGKRVVCHQIENANKMSTPYMSTGTLPLRLQQFNRDVTASPSRMKATCLAVFSETSLPDDSKRNQIITRSATLPTKTVTNVESVLTVFKVADTFGGKANRKKTIPKTLHYSIIDAAGEQRVVQIVIRFTSILAISGGTWTQPHADSPAMYNSTASVLVPGVQVSQRFLNTGATAQSVTADFNSQAYHLKTEASGVAEVVAVVSARCMTNHSVDITLGVDWTDL